MKNGRQDRIAETLTLKAACEGTWKARLKGG